jgi:tetratricopeptide (TPR) repeat protein
MFENSEDLHDLILDVIGKIVTDALSIAQLIDWTAAELRGASATARDLPAPALRQLACQLARMAWNVTPQPAHDFRVQAIPSPGRNDRCFAGLDCKHKQCCGQMPRMPTLDPEVGWLGVCEALSASALDALLKSGRLPERMQFVVAGRMLETDPARARRMLEPKFAGPLGNLKEDSAELFWTLLDCYDALDKPRLKQKLIDRAIAEGRGTIRADALQRMATVLADRGEHKGAWDHFRMAQRENPDDPALAHLEVILLTNQGRTEESAERARFWLAKLRRDGLANDDPLARFLQEASRGRVAEALSDLAVRDAGDAPKRFLAALRSALETPVTPGRLRATEIVFDPQADPAESMARQLTGMGVPVDQARREAEELLRDLNKREIAELDAGQGVLPLAAPPAKRERSLAADAKLHRLEEAWHRVWPCPKPHSVAPMPWGDIDDPWDARHAEDWIEFVERHPEAAGSLDILDDWLIALEMLESASGRPMILEMAPRVTERAAAIVRAAEVADVELPWNLAGNRPGLRLLVRRAYDLQHAGDAAGAREAMGELLRLNPNDNHGLREELVTLDLAAGDDPAALAVIARYPEDVMPSLLYGAVLAYFRLGKLPQARAALKHARNVCGNVEAYLLPARKAKPKLSEYGIVVGGDDEAWLYREAMRSVWAATPGALAWLKSA